MFDVDAVYENDIHEQSLSKKKKQETAKQTTTASISHFKGWVTTMATRCYELFWISY